LNRKMFTLSAIAVSAILLFSIASVLAPSDVTVWTSKEKFAPGEKGTLNVAFYNDDSNAVAIKNVTIVYSSWQAYVGGQWVGNQTIILSPDVPISGFSSKLLNDVTEISFTVPTDGRATSTSVQVTIGTDNGYRQGSGFINVPQTPSYMDQIIMLFTIQVILIILGALIIAVTIFLSSRRPQVTWKAEQK
jgi:hypothetical protein